MTESTETTIGLAGLPVPDGYADLPPHQYAASGYCTGCWEERARESYAEYVTHWYTHEYEGDHDTAPMDEAVFVYLAATCLQDGGSRFTNGVILSQVPRHLLSGGGQAGAAISANGAPVAFADSLSATHRNIPVSGDHFALYVRSTNVLADLPATSIWSKVVDQPKTPVSCDRTPDELRLALEIVDDLEQSATDAGQPALARQLARAFAAIERFRTF